MRPKQPAAEPQEHLFRARLENLRAAVRECPTEAVG
jgi:hypothetical protein